MQKNEDKGFHSLLIDDFTMNQLTFFGENQQPIFKILEMDSCRIGIFLRLRGKPLENPGTPL